MKLLWCRESWRMVRVSPSPPSSTSWWARRPRSRTACTGTPSTSAPRAPSSAVAVASGCGAQPAFVAGLGDQLGGAGGGAGGGVGLVGVVQLDDLDGLEVAGGLLRELHGQDGADGEVRGDEHAGLRGGGEPGRSAARAARRSSRWCRRRRGCRAGRRSRGCPSPTPGVVSSTATWAPASASVSSLSPRPRAATSSMSSAASTARTASEPMRPWAPRTATRSLLIVSRFLTGATARRRLRAGGPACLSFSGPMTDSEGRCPSTSRATARTSSGVTGGDPGQHVVDRHLLAPAQLALADAVHQRAGVLQAEDGGAGELADGAADLLVAQAVRTATWSSSSRQILRTSWTWLGRQPA